MTDTSLTYNIFAKFHGDDGKMTKFGKAATVATAAVAGLAVKLGADAVTAASDLNETMTKSQVLFGKATPVVAKFADTAAKGLGQSKQQALDAAATFAVFGKGAGLTGSKLAGFSTRLVRLSSDMASFSNTTPDEAIEALGSALRGESEPIRKYGVLINEAAIKAQAGSMGLVKMTTDHGKLVAAQNRAILAQRAYNDALKEHGKGSDEALRAEANLANANASLEKATTGTIPALTQQQKVIATQALIFAQTKDAQGDFARTSGGLANQQRILKAELENTSAAVGTKLLPFVLSVVTGFASFITVLQAHSTTAKVAATAVGVLAVGFGSLVAVTKAHLLIMKAHTAATALGAAVQAVSSSTLGTWLGVKALEAQAWVVSTARTVAGSVATGAHTVVTNVAAAATRVWAAGQWLLNAALTANPIGLVVVAIAALAAGVIYAYKHSETFRNIVDGAFRVVGATAGWLWNNAIQPAFASIRGAFTAVGTVFTTMWDNVLHPAFSALTSVFLAVAGGIVNAAATAFGWIPGIGGKLRDARDAFNSFKDHVNTQLGLIDDKNVKVTFQAVTIGFGRYAGKQVPVPGAATGGPVFGAGSGTSDSIPAMLSNGEHVWTAREVAAAGGHNAVQSMRSSVLRRATGGPILVNVGNRSTGFNAADDVILATGAGLGQSLGGPLRRGLDFAAGQRGKPYVWGGVGPGGYDCSGFMSAIANVVLGQSPYSRRFATDSMVGGGVGGFVRGNSGGFRIGVMHGNPGHTAGTIMGVNVESRGGDGVVVGSGARGASNGLFSSIYHLNGYAKGGAVGDLPFDSVRRRNVAELLQALAIDFDKGGYLPTGTSLVHNGTGRPEPVGAAPIVIQNLTLPNVTDPASFVRGLQDYVRSNGPIRGVSFA